MTKADLLAANDALFTANGANEIEGLDVNLFIENLINTVWSEFGNAADVKLNLKGYVNFGEDVSRTVKKGDLFINYPIGEAVPDGSYLGDWAIALDDFDDITGITIGETTAYWFYIPFGKLNDPATMQTLLEAFNPFTEVSFTEVSYLVELNEVESKNVTLKHKTTAATYAVSNFGKGTAGDTKKLWIELGNTTSFIVRVYCAGLGSTGIHIPGVSLGAYVEFKGNGLSAVHGFIDAVCLANNQWIVTNISNSTTTGPKSSEGTLHLDTTEAFEFIQNTMFVPAICDDDTEITLAEADHLNGVTHVMLVDCDGNALTFSADYDIISGTIDTTAGAINHVTMIYDIVNAKVRVIIQN